MADGEDKKQKSQWSQPARIDVSQGTKHPPASSVSFSKGGHTIYQSDRKFSGEKTPGFGLIFIAKD